MWAELRFWCPLQYVGRVVVVVSEICGPRCGCGVRNIWVEVCLWFLAMWWQVDRVNQSPRMAWHSMAWWQLDGANQLPRRKKPPRDASRKSTGEAVYGAECRMRVEPPSARASLVCSLGPKQSPRASLYPLFHSLFPLLLRLMCRVLDHQRRLCRDDLGSSCRPRQQSFDVSSVQVLAQRTPSLVVRYVPCEGGERKEGR